MSNQYQKILVILGQVFTAGEKISSERQGCTNEQ